MNGPQGQGQNLPLRKFKAGGITATIWENQSRQTNNNGPATFHTVSLERSYKDNSGNWKTSNSFRLQELPKADLVLQKAYEFLALKDAAQEQVEVF